MHDITFVSGYFVEMPRGAIVGEDRFNESVVYPNLGWDIEIWVFPDFLILFHGDCANLVSSANIC